jgi:hypothetical protein
MQRKRQIAANRVYTSPKTYYTNTVVEIEDGIVTNTFPLQGEPAMTEWFSGIIVVTSQQDINNDIKSINDFYTQTSTKTIAYHIATPPSQQDKFSRGTPITRLK